MNQPESFLSPPCGHAGQPAGFDLPAADPHSAPRSGQGPDAAAPLADLAAAVAVSGLPVDLAAELSTAQALQRMRAQALRIRAATALLLGAMPLPCA